MCPVCLATAAVLAAKATGSTGAAVLVAANYIRKPRRAAGAQSEAKEIPNARDNDRNDADQRGIA